MNPKFSSIATAPLSGHGPYFSVHRVDLEQLAGLARPVMMFDHYQMSGPTFAPHPHAGFSAVTYVFGESAGALRNRDSMGNDVVVEPGDVLWTEAGSGVIHDEFPERRGEVVTGLQLFVNLSRRHKHRLPRMLHARRADIGIHVDASGNRTRVLSGRYGPVAGRIEPTEPFDFFDLEHHGPWSWNVSPNRSVMVYVRSGRTAIQVDGKRAVASQHEAWAMRAGDREVALSLLPESRASVLVLSGMDAQEPVAVHGPFIMNTQAELASAFERYRAGGMGRLAHPA